MPWEIDRTRQFYADQWRPANPSEPPADCHYAGGPGYPFPRGRGARVCALRTDPLSRRMAPMGPRTSSEHISSKRHAKAPQAEKSDPVRRTDQWPSRSPTLKRPGWFRHPAVQLRDSASPSRMRPSAHRRHSRPQSKSGRRAGNEPDATGGLAPPNLTPNTECSMPYRHFHATAHHWSWGIRGGQGCCHLYMPATERLSSVLRRDSPKMGIGPTRAAPHPYRRFGT